MSPPIAAGALLARRGRLLASPKTPIEVAFEPVGGAGSSATVALTDD